MKYVKILGLLALAVTALMAFAATASATTLTTETDGTTPYSGTIHATAGTLLMHGVATIECHESTIQGDVTDAGGPDETHTVKVSLTSLTYSNCTGDNHITVNKPGILEIHTDTQGVNDGNGTVTWSGAEITWQITSLGLSCVFTTNATDFGTLTGSRRSGHPEATLTVASAKIPRTGGSIFCGSSSTWTGEYTITTPGYLDVD